MVFSLPKYSLWALQLLLLYFKTDMAKITEGFFTLTFIKFTCLKNSYQMDLPFSHIKPLIFGQYVCLSHV